MIKIGIIDSGADISKIGLSPGVVDGVRIFRNAAGALQYEHGHFSDRIGHGTTCLSIIHGYAPDAFYYVVKIFDAQLRTDAQVLAAAINWCIDQGTDIVNVSSGIQSDYIPDALAEACERAFDANTIIVAAGHNFHKVSFPAYYPKVIGVGSIYLENYDDVLHVPGSPIDFYTCDRLPGGQYYDMHGSSFACPKVTGRIAQLIAHQERPGLAAARELMIQHAVPGVMPPHVHYPEEYGYDSVWDYDADQVHGIACKYLLRDQKFPDIRKLFVAPLGDPAFNLLRNVDTAALQQHYTISGSFKSYRKPLRELFSGPDVEQADTIAIGRLAEYIFPGNEQTVYREFTRLMQAGKNFMVFDELSVSILESIRSSIQTQSRIYLPEHPAKAYRDICRFRYLPKLQTPVIAVAGTGSQELISFQLWLKKLLEKEAYSVEYISPTPYGALTEACFSFPLVYWPELQMHGQHAIHLLRNMLKGIQEFCRPDIILTGLPDKVVAPDNHAGLDWSDNAAFLYAIQPDALMMVIDEKSTAESIEANRRIAEAYAKGPVICYFIQSRQGHYALHDFLVNKNVITGEHPAAAEQAVASIVDFFSISNTANLVK